MKRIWFTLAIACLAITGTARADVWGRVIPNSLISRTQDKTEAAPSPAANQPNVQAPAATADYEGYPFAGRCGGGCLGCCAKIWEGYSSSCGCGLGRGLLAHGTRHCGCDRQHAQGCASKCSSSGCSSGCGGCVNSFGGGASCGGGGCGGVRGLGWHANGLQAFGGCGCGKHHHHLHHLHGLWHACGLGCNKGCESNGCNSCNGHSHDAAEKQGVNPPEAPNEPTPVIEQGPAGTPGQANEKSAFRSWYPSTLRHSPAGF